MQRRILAFFLPMAAFLLAGGATARCDEAETIGPIKNPIALFNGKNLDGFYTWLSDTKYEDPRKVFAVEEGAIHISGDGGGYLCTKRRYRDYHLVVEYRWGRRTWAHRKNLAKDSGVLVHCSGPDGGYKGLFMAGVEAQIIEGGTGDLLLVPGQRADGSVVPVAFAAEIERRGKAVVWRRGGQMTRFPDFVRIDWFGRDPKWRDTLGFRGPHDLDSPGHQWTRLDIVCRGGHIAYRVNGVLANEVFDTSPSAGKILIQSEWAEIVVRRLELLPLDQKKHNSLRRKGLESTAHRELDLDDQSFIGRITSL